MLKTLTLPSGIEVTISGRVFEFRGPPDCIRGPGGATVDVTARHVVTLSDEDVAELADLLPVCAGCGDFRLGGHQCPVAPGTPERGPHDA